ncbi:MAG: four helix bundle protein [Planctomycetaceae bacterium]
MKDFRELKVWEKAHQLTLDVYKQTTIFPRDEVYGLTSQLRRSATSIPSNIAEGCGRDGDADLARFLQIALGSTSELEYQLQLAHELGYLKDEPYRQLSDCSIEVKRMLGAFLQTLRKRTRYMPETDHPSE